MLDSNHYLRLPGRERDLSQAVRPVAPQPSFYARRGKGLPDRVLAAVFLVVVSPLLHLLAGLLRVAPWPGVIYRQQRIGLGGEPFTLLKFRTMHPDRRRSNGGEARTDRRLEHDRRSGVHRRLQQVGFDGPDRRHGLDRRESQRRQVEGGRRLNYKSEQDPRHTRLGRMMPATILDELPRLANVLRGELSLVGPHPELPEAAIVYEAWQHARHRIRPGLTGLWQISERCTGDLMLMYVDVDLDYANRVSLGRDLLILGATLPATLGIQGRGRCRCVRVGRRTLR